MKLESPFTEEKIRALKVGEMVLITGKVFTGRDAVHKHIHKGGEVPVSMKDGILYHCGPVVMKNKKGEWVVTAAGPTTSIREEPYQDYVIEKMGVRGIIGKGGMGPKTLEALKKHGCVYLHAVGGAAQVLAECIKKVHGVHLHEKFGSPEAIWEMEVVDFPAVVTMDSHGNSLHKEIMESSKKKFQDLVLGGEK